VLRKKPLIFLHWYHHVTVLLFCWNAYATMAGSGLYFVAMNYTVHALMYGYYCLQALNMCPKSFPAFLITFAQIAQMFVGTGVCISAWYYMLSGKTCHNDISNLTAGALMYGSYLYLFVDFAMKRYGKKGSSNKAKSL
jgi:elongation of very long chain fatty acids protein 6